MTNLGIDLYASHLSLTLSDVLRIISTHHFHVSHELRTPLTTILGYITYLKTEKAGALSQAQKDCLIISEEEAELLNHLIEELLDLSKIETGEFRVDEVTLENDIPEDLPLVLADKKSSTPSIRLILQRNADTADAA